MVEPIRPLFPTLRLWTNRHGPVTSFGDGTWPFESGERPLPGDSDAAREARRGRAHLAEDEEARRRLLELPGDPLGDPRDALRLRRRPDPEHDAAAGTDDDYAPTLRRLALRLLDELPAGAPGQGPP